MPELPEVENVMRRLRPALEGHRIVSAWAGSHRNYGPLPDIADTSVAGLLRRGKWLVVELDSGTDLLVHLGMTGVLLINPDPAQVERHVRMRLVLDSGDELLLRDPRGFGRVRAVDHGDFSSIASLAALGPEPLPGVDLEPAVRELTRAGATVKARLLSGRVVAGVGNYLADEALWRAGVHPKQRQLSTIRARRLMKELVALVGESIDAGGSTLRDYRLPDGSRGSSQLLLRCYGRRGLPCDRCRGTLRYDVVAGRGTTFCARCQRLSN